MAFIPTNAQALDYDQCVDCVVTLVRQAAIIHFVDQEMMVRVAACETGRTFNRYAVNGKYVGLYQLDPTNQQHFFDRGYTDLWDPAQQANYAAEEFHAGSGRRNWISCGGY